jgi:hypothetical protein
VLKRLKFGVAHGLPYYLRGLTENQPQLIGADIAAAI